jgi:hypothetical protein
MFSLCGNDRKLEVTVRELRPKASYSTDVEIEEYEYRGFVITTKLITLAEQIFSCDEKVDT